VATPADLLFSKEHEWVKLDGDSATIGVTDYAQNALGDIVYVELPRVGSAIKQFSNVGVIESVKAVSDVYAPVSGEVTEINGLLADSPEKLNEDPHGAAWLVKLKLSAPTEAESLMTAAEYQTYVGAEK